MGGLAKPEDGAEEAWKRLLQLGSQCHKATCTLLAVVDDARQPQHLQVMAERGFGHSALELAGAPFLAAGQVGDHRKAHRVAQRVQDSPKRDLFRVWMRQLFGL